jgi:long-chain acyl-CoA synthetase
VSGANLAGLLDGPARWGADRPAVVLGERPVRTWAQLARAVARRAAGLCERHGVMPGDAVALFAANHPAYLEALFAIWHAGAVAVPIGGRLHRARRPTWSTAATPASASRRPTSPRA